MANYRAELAAHKERMAAKREAAKQENEQRERHLDPATTPVKSAPRCREVQRKVIGIARRGRPRKERKD